MAKDIYNTKQHKSIIEQCKKGNAKSYYKLYDLYSKAMFNVCVRLLNSIEEAEDVLQVAFTDAFMQLKTFNYESTFGAWLKKIVINRCINQLKKHKETLFELEKIEIISEDEQEQEPKYTVCDIQEAMKVLPDGSRTIFSLYLLEGYDHAEISEILNISESTSKSQYMRAKQKIRKQLLNRETNTQMVM